MSANQQQQQGNTQPGPPATPIMTRGTPGQYSIVAPPPPVRPTSPTMGTCEETYPGSQSYYYAFGGKPYPDWSGIMDKSSRLMSDLCFRSLDPVSGQKSTHYRTKGLSNKYDSKDCLTDFQSDVWDHLVKYGLDTISYLPNPKDLTQVLDVVNKHAQFTGDITLAQQLSDNLSARFDFWDKKHDAEAKSFLLSSLSEELKKNFKPFHDKDKDSFSLTWLKLIHYLVSSNSRTFDKLKDDIRRIRPQQYPGQNIEKMSTDYMTKAEELVNAGYFDHSLILNMVDGFLCSSKDAKGTFHHSMNDLRRRVDKVQQSTIFMSRTDQADEFTRQKLSFKDVCFIAVKEYKTLCDDNMWEPKKLPRDRQGPSIQAANLAAINKVHNLIANMFDKSKPNQSQTSSSKQKKSDSTKGGGHCFNCGKKGHIIKNCPEPHKSPEERKGIRHKLMPAWKLKAPGIGESHSES